MTAPTSLNIIKTAIEYEVDQYDILESFICSILNIDADTLYQLIDLYNDIKKGDSE